MEGSRRSAQADDPSADFSIISLLPRTPSSQGHEAESILCFLESEAGESSKDVLEQVKEIDRSHQCTVRVTESDENMALAESKDHQQGRRPALGRQRAQFSLKHVAPKNSMPCGDVSSQLEHIEEPEEYFATFERFENAEKELKKLRGDISMDPVQNNQKETRKRRPGLVRKKASYNHHFSVTDAALEVCKVSQDVAPDNGSSSVRMSNNILRCNMADELTTLQPMNTDDLSLVSDKRGADDKEDVANALLDNLLCSFKELGEGKEEALLRKSLHIKSIDVGKIHLPELHTVQLIDPKASNTIQRQNRLSTCQLPQTSAYQARSPIAKISALYRRISSELKTHLVSPSSVSSDRSGWKAKRCISSSGVSNVHYETSSPVDKLLIPQTGPDENSKNVKKLTEGCSDKNITEHSQNIMDNGTNISDQLEEEANDMDLNNILSKDSCPEVEHAISNCCEIKMMKKLMSTDHECTADHSSGNVNVSLCNGTHSDDVITNDSSSVVEHPTSACHEINMTDSCPEVELLISGCEINMTEGLTSTGHECAAGCSSLRSDDDTRLSHAHNIVQDEVTVMAEDEQLAGVNYSSVYPCPSTSLPPTEGPAADTSTFSRENDEVHRPQASQNEAGKQKSSRTRQNKEKMKSKGGSLAGAGSRNEAGKQRSYRTGQNKENLKSKRQSLAGAGLTWQSGVRRSTRIRSKPLEFWRGERFLYGRIHDSLATVIGVKYASPAKEEGSKGQALKVKSFVPDEYKDLISQAAS